LFDPTTETWTDGGDMTSARSEYVMMALPSGPSGRVLVAGGRAPTNAALATAEIFAFVPNGGGCVHDGECTSRHCVDAVCCGTACTAPCTACTSAKKGGGSDGVCGPAAASTDPHGDCTDEGPATCGTNGMCDGSGSCALYTAGTPCGTPSCSAG